MLRAAILAVVSAACLSVHARAEDVRIAIAPPSSEVEFRAYRLGVIPLDGSFREFGGWLSYDPDRRGRCEVHLAINAASVSVPEELMRGMVAGPEFLDVARFPSLTYSGTCDADGVSGALTMHGVTGAFRLELTWMADKVQAEGHFVRADWGMTALPLLAGRTIRIRVVIPLTMHTMTGK
ncbi:MAG TPA: YceI family protein [Acetobacteraceae bacterium]|jgi:polyisoprenoid-binding protein YceI|nr:YceI family protein [Acetobacteraceae bacterium]